jgi:hypothetical protein
MPDDKRKWRTLEELASGSTRISWLNEPVAPEGSDDRARRRRAELKVIEGGQGEGGKGDG